MIVRDMDICDVQRIIKKGDRIRVGKRYYTFVGFGYCEYLHEDRQDDRFPCTVGCKGMFKIENEDGKIKEYCFSHYRKCLIHELFNDFIEDDEFEI